MCHSNKASAVKTWKSLLNDYNESRGKLLNKNVFKADPLMEVSTVPFQLIRADICRSEHDTYNHNSYHYGTTGC